MKTLPLTLAVLAACTGAPDAPLPYGAGAEDCGSCHTETHDEWRGSAHATSGQSPVLAALLPEVEQSWGGFARKRCESCHSPGHGGDAGIGCVTCHAAIGNQEEGNGRLAVDVDVAIAGPLSDPEPTPAHASRPGDFLASPSLCGTCHEVTGPGLFVEPTLTEWRASPAAGIGQSCLDCHMPETGARRLTDDAALERPVRAHRFVGFDPPWDASPDEAIAAATRTRELLASALALAATRDGDDVDVSVTNVAAGHAVPTGATFLRDLWVDLESEGVVLAPRVLVIRDQPTRGGAPVALVTDADAIEHGALAPGEAVHARVAAPPGGFALVLRGRAIRAEVLAALALDAVVDRVPTHEIARVVVTP